MKLRSPLVISSSPLTKDGKTIKRLAQYGAGAAVTKSILPLPAKNPRPFMAKIGKNMINCEGWSDIGAEDWIAKEFKIAKSADIPVIASLAAQPDAKSEAQLMENARRITEAGAAAIEIPAYDPRDMIRLVPIVRKGSDLPVFGKFALWSFHIEPYIDAAVKAGTDAFTCIDSIGPALVIDIEKRNSILGSATGLGRISGPTIKPFALYSVFTAFRKYMNPILGCGGVSNATDVIEFVMAGARATQLCTSVMLHGPQLMEKINQDLRTWLEEHDYGSLQDVQGSLHKRILQREKNNEITFSPKPPVFIKDNCSSCKTCARVCPYMAIAMKDDKGSRLYPKIDAKLCYGCGFCISACPTGALQSPYRVVK